MNINKKFFNWSIVIALLTAYMLPGISSDGFAFEYGYPFKFFTIYNHQIDIANTIFNSTSFNILSLGLNILVIYRVIYIINKVIRKIVVKQL